MESPSEKINLKLGNQSKNKSAFYATEMGTNKHNNTARSYRGSTTIADAHPFFFPVTTRFLGLFSRASLLVFTFLTFWLGRDRQPLKYFQATLPSQLKVKWSLKLSSQIWWHGGKHCRLRFFGKIDFDPELPGYYYHNTISDGRMPKTQCFLHQQWHHSRLCDLFDPLRYGGDHWIILQSGNGSSYLYNLISCLCPLIPIDLNSTLLHFLRLRNCIQRKFPCASQFLAIPLVACFRG